MGLLRMCSCGIGFVYINMVEGISKATPALKVTIVVHIMYVLAVMNVQSNTKQFSMCMKCGATSVHHNCISDW